MIFIDYSMMSLGDRLYEGLAHKTRGITRTVKGTELQESSTVVSTIGNTMDLLMILQVEIFTTAFFKEIFCSNTTLLESVVTCCHMFYESVRSYFSYTRAFVLVEHDVFTKIRLSARDKPLWLPL